MISAELNTLGSLAVVMTDAWPPTITVNVGTASPISINLGIPGPAGPAGPPGIVDGLRDLDDVVLTNVQNGDLLVYSASKFRNVPSPELTDGGNF